MPSGPIQVDGPGPLEPQAGAVASETPSAATAATHPGASLPAGGSSSELINPHLTEEDNDGHDGGGDDDDDYPASPSGPADPYANLDGAFGGYTTDEPKPHRNDDLAGLF